MRFMFAACFLCFYSLMAAILERVTKISVAESILLSIFVVGVIFSFLEITRKEKRQ